MAEDAKTEAFERAVEDQLSGGAQVEIDSESGVVTVDDDLGSFTSGDDLARPTWFPVELPLPEDFQFDTYLDTDAIQSARGRLDTDVVQLFEYYRSTLESLGWSIDSEVLDEPAFFQLLATDPSGARLDIEYVQGSLAFVIGRARPGD